MNRAPEPSPDPEPSTLDLARAARSGAGAEFGKLYERVAPAIYAWAALRLRPSTRAQLDPEDVVQEVWCRALSIFSGAETHGNFRAWIFSVAKFVLRELLRKQERALRLDAGAGESTRVRLIEQVPDDVTTATHRIARNDALAKFVAKVQELDPEDRALIVHCGLEGLTCGEAAERLGISRDAAAKRWQRLRARLEEQRVPDGLLELVE